MLVFERAREIKMEFEPVTFRGGHLCFKPVYEWWHMREHERILPL